MRCNAALVVACRRGGWLMLSAWRMWDVRPGVSLVFRKCEVGNGGVKSGGSGKKAFFSRGQGRGPEPVASRRPPVPSPCSAPLQAPSALPPAF